MVSSGMSCLHSLAVSSETSGAFASEGPTNTQEMQQERQIDAKVKCGLPMNDASGANGSVLPKSSGGGSRFNRAWNDGSTAFFRPPPLRADRSLKLLRWFSQLSAQAASVGGPASAIRPLGTSRTKAARRVHRQSRRARRSVEPRPSAACRVSRSGAFQNSFWSGLEPLGRLFRSR
jgi:hypothetical protein